MTMVFGEFGEQEPSRGEVTCADFRAGINLASGNSKALRSSCEWLVEFLPR